MLSRIDGTWHVSQTWLVVLGAVLFGAFPAAYASLLSRLYGLFILLVLALTIRGLGLEYRHHAQSPRLWRKLAGWGAFATIMTEGLILSALVDDMPDRVTNFSGLGALLDPSFLPSVLLLLASAVLCGGAWLMRQNRDQPSPYRPTGVRAATTGLVGVLVFGVLLCARIMTVRETTVSGMLHFILPFAAVGIIALALCLMSLRAHWRGSPLPWALILVGTVLAMGAAALYPAGEGVHVAAASEDALWFLTGAFALLLPPLLAFQIFQYRLQPSGSVPADTDATTPESSDD
jgi:cytochrome d ubiquinol oxidase subunit II